MAELLEGPLRGRIQADLLVRPFDHLEAAHFWGITDPHLAFRLDAILGGTPGYRELVRRTPSSMDDFDAWVVDEVLSPASALFREDEWLLGEQRGLENRGLYLSVLSTVAGGATPSRRSPRHWAAPSRACCTPRRTRARGLPGQGRRRAPEAAAHLSGSRSDHPLPPSRTPPRAAMYEDRRGAEAWADSQQSFGSLVLGPHFEQLAAATSAPSAQPSSVSPSSPSAPPS